MIVKYKKGNCRYSVRDLEDTFITELEKGVRYPVAGNYPKTVREALKEGTLELLENKCPKPPVVIVHDVTSGRYYSDCPDLMEVLKVEDHSKDVANEYIVFETMYLTKKEERTIQAITNRILKWKKANGIPLVTLKDVKKAILKEENRKKEELKRDLRKAEKEVYEIRKELSLFGKEQLW